MREIALAKRTTGQVDQDIVSVPGASLRVCPHDVRHRRQGTQVEESLVDGLVSILQHSLDVAVEHGLDSTVNNTVSVGRVSMLVAEHLSQSQTQRKV